MLGGNGNWLTANWKKGLIALVLTMMAAGGVAGPMVAIDNTNEAQDMQIAGIVDMMATDTELSDAVAPLATKAELTVVDTELQTHMAAYTIFVGFITDAVEANTIDIATAWEWIDSFNVIWADFQEEYELDQASLYNSMAAWYTYFSTNCCSELD